MKTSSVARRLPEEQEKRADTWRWAVAVLVSMAVFLDTVDVSIINVALPNLQRDLQLQHDKISAAQQPGRGVHIRRRYPVVRAFHHQDPLPFRIDARADQLVKAKRYNAFGCE